MTVPSFLPSSAARLRTVSWLVMLALIVGACGGPLSDGEEGEAGDVTAASTDTETSTEESTGDSTGDSTDDSTGASEESTDKGDTEDGSRGVQGGRDTKRETLVVVEPLKIGPVRDQVVVSSRVETRSNVQVFPQLSGLPIASVAAEEGDHVEAGDILMTLYEIDMSLAEQTARANRDQMLKDIERSELALEEDSRRVTRAERQAVKAAADFARIEGLGAEGLVTRQEVDDQRLTTETFQDDLDLARFAERGSKIALELSEIAAGRAEIEWEQAKTELGHTKVRAPISGVVAERDCDVGELSSVSMPAFRIVDVDDLILNLRVPQDALGEVATGQAVVVRAVTHPDLHFQGTVRTVNPVLDQDSGAVRVIVDLTPAPGLASGLFCEARITTSSRDDALLVSKRAVMYEDDQPVIFAVSGEDQHAIKIAFVAGVSTPTQVEILSRVDGDPISADLRVVVVGQENLKDGAPVRIVEEAF